MISDSLLKQKGMKIWGEHLGLIDMERFIVLISRDAADYTSWHEQNDDDLNVKDYSQKAMDYQKNKQQSPNL
ncbi:MAG: hypothetical protein LBQ66_12120 [Planctomycetaceae bacterium]|jgi:hypothetical protein|nr:hypothetical protein [Planctomycetaceae bacterium]